MVVSARHRDENDKHSVVGWIASFDSAFKQNSIVKKLWTSRSIDRSLSTWKYPLEIRRITTRSVSFWFFLSLRVHQMTWYSSIRTKERINLCCLSDKSAKENNKERRRKTIFVVQHFVQTAFNRDKPIGRTTQTQWQGKTIDDVRFAQRTNLFLSTRNPIETKAGSHFTALIPPVNKIEFLTSGRSKPKVFDASPIEFTEIFV